MPGVDWGNVPSWVSATGSLAAFGTAAWAGRAAWKQAMYSAGQQRERDIQEEQAQASKVAAWLHIIGADGEDLEAWLRYVNFSDLPVYNMVATPVAYQGGLTILYVVEPRKSVSEKLLPWLTDWLRKTYLELSPLEQDTLPGGVEAAGVRIDFLDVQNNTWAREPNGRLRKIGRRTVDEVLEPGTYAHRLG
jgi:hypothetical protein